MPTIRTVLVVAIISTTIITTANYYSNSHTRNTRKNDLICWIEEDIKTKLLHTDKAKQIENTSEEIANKFREANQYTSEDKINSATTAVLSNADDVFTVDFIMSILYEESRFNFDAISEANAIGIAQIQPETGEWVATNILGINYNSDMLYDPAYNINLSIAYLKWLYDYYNGDMHRTLTAYNMGIGGVERYAVSRGSYVSEYSMNIIDRTQERR